MSRFLKSKPYGENTVRRAKACIFNTSAPPRPNRCCKA
jgi:hypothetical protein